VFPAVPGSQILNQEDGRMKYECPCGYVYDEEAEGVKWEDLPDNYECPVCGLGKADFTPVEE